VTGPKELALGSVQLALMSGVLVQWLIDPSHAADERMITDGILGLAAHITGPPGAERADAPGAERADAAGAGRAGKRWARSGAAGQALSGAAGQALSGAAGQALSGEAGCARSGVSGCAEWAGRSTLG